MLCYAASNIEGEICEIYAEGLRAYLSDVFNWLDVFNTVLLFVLQMIHIDAVSRDDLTLQRDLGVPLQSIATLGVWLRLLQCMFLFPNAGPQLLMTLQMLGDLWQFIAMIAFFLIAFTSAFTVLLYDGPPEDYLHDFFYEPNPNSIWNILRALARSAIDTEPSTSTDNLVGYNNTGWWGFALVVSFGLLVVVLLLNLLIAVFARSVDQVTQDIDSHFKLKYGQIVMKARRMGLMPRPVNLLRRFVLTVFAIAAPLRTSSAGPADENTGELRRGSSSLTPTRGAGGKRRSTMAAARISVAVGGRLSVAGRILRKAWGEHKRGAEKTDSQMAGDFIERAVSAQVRLYPEEIIAYDVANVQQSHDAQLYRATMANTVNLTATGVSFLSDTVRELQAAQRTQGERVDELSKVLEQVGARQLEMHEAIQQVLSRMPVPSGASTVQSLPQPQPPVWNEPDEYRRTRVHAPSADDI